MSVPVYSIYVDAVINHMTGAGWGVGSAGSDWSGDDEWFPAVPYYQGKANTECHPLLNNSPVYHLSLGPCGPG